MSERLDKLMSREFLPGLIAAALLSLAYFFKGGVEFGDYAMWLDISLGICVGALTVQKVGDKITTKGPAQGGQQ